MSYDELCDLVRESINEMQNCGTRAERIVIASRLEQECRERHYKYTGSMVLRTFFGVPLEFKDLPRYLEFYIESEVATNELEN